MGKGFNGTKLLWPSTSESGGGISDVTHNQSGADVQIGGSTSAGYEYETGLTDESVEISLVGGTTIIKGATGKATVKWNDGSSNTLIEKAVVMSVSKTGSVDNPITSSITLRPRST